MSIRERILLATDLSARSDRAFDRAVMIAKRADTELAVLHVIEPIPGSRGNRTALRDTQAAILRAQLTHDLGDCAERTKILIEDGDPAETIVRVARELQSTLVVVGVARLEPLGRYTLGSTVERLVRGLDQPLLVVTERPRRPYERIAVAVDFSPISRRTVELAGSLFPGKPIVAFHAFQPLASYAAPDVDAHREQFRQVAEGDFATWLSSAELAPDTRDRVTPQIEAGDVASRLREAAAHGGFDLVIVGNKGRGRLFEFFVGSVANQILAELPCDTLFVRETTA